MRRALAAVAALVRLAGVAAAVATAIATAVAWPYAAAAEIRLADDRGREIVLPRAAARIVTL
ncbi:MAG: iron-siderophore ABC transporter substrate-binding protein, partial [Bacteroidota bacterium]